MDRETLRNKQLDVLLNGSSGERGREMIAARPYFDAVRRTIARQYRFVTYEDYCDIHGLASFYVSNGKCSACSPKRLGRPPSSTPRAVARRAGEQSYTDTCPAHGMTAHSVRTGRCDACEQLFGPPHRLSDRPRAVARRAGEPHYADTCPEHGPTAHYTQNGKCAQCFTTAGIRRNPRTDVSPARVEARRAGRPRFVATCAEHGETDHSTQHGKCLTCYNAMGYPRPRA